MAEIEEVLGGPEYAPYTALMATLCALVCAVFLALGKSPLLVLGATENATAALVAGVVGVCGILAGCRFVRRGDWRFRTLGWLIIITAVVAIILVTTHH